MSGSTLSRRVGAAFVMSGAIFVGALSAMQPARGDELSGTNGAPPPVLERRADAAKPSPQATAGPSFSQDPNAGPVASPAGGIVAADVPPGRFGPLQKRHFEHWEVAPTAMWTFSTGSDAIPPGGGQQSIGSPAGNTLPLDVVRLTGDARYRFNSRYGLHFQRIEHTGATGRVYKGKTPQYGGQSEDLEERFLATDQLDPNTVVRAGYARRWRTCCPAAGATGNKNPRFHSGFFSDIAFRFGPNTIGSKPFTTSFRWEEYKHNGSVPKPANDEGVKPTFAATLYGNLFLLHQTKLVPFYGLEYFSTYFSYSPQMTITYRKVYGLSVRQSRDTTVRIYVKNDQSGGALNSVPDTAHKSSLFIEATDRIHW
jgi:hypothetical protein